MTVMMYEGLSEHQEDRVYSGLFCLPCIKALSSPLGVDLNELLLRDGGAQAMGTTGMMTGLSLPWPWEMSTFQKPGKTQNYGSA